MHLSNFRKSFTSSLATIGCLGFSILVVPNSANAFSVNYSNDFETSGFTDWNTTGDTSIQPTLTGTHNGDAKSYNAGSGNQAVITNACSSTAYTPTTNDYDDTECFDTQNQTQPRNDDPAANAGTFNYSDNDQTDANAENSAATFPENQITNIQEFLGLDANALDIPLQNNTTNIGGNRTPKEGSAIKLNDTINSTVPFTISFDWSYLTNDGQDQSLGDSDYAFAVIYEETSTTSSREPIVLADSDNPTIPTITNADDAYALITSGSYNSGVLPAGNYNVGLGVVDIEGVNRSSALLVDNFAATTAVPFEFSPSAGLGIVVSMFGWNYLRRRQSL